MSKNNEKYAAIDFETMDSFRSSVCAVGVAIIENGKITETFYSLINPNTSYENPFCAKAHGLSLNECRKHPKFPDVWEKVETLIKGCKLIAHNAGFEKSCINACNEEFGTSNDYEYIDTLKLSRKTMPNLLSHKLDVVCKNLGVKLEKHHDALCDSLACANIFLKLNEKYDISELLKETKKKSRK